MDQKSSQNKRIAKNTLLLYIRMLFIMGVSLFTSRIVLKTLGIEDYGIYNAVGGTIALLGLLTSSLSTSCLRYFTYELGKENGMSMNRIFSLTLTIHVVLAIIVLVVGEIAGFWFINSEMNIPQSRLVAANAVYQCAMLSFFITLITIPYNTLMIAHERMSAFAYIGVFDVLLKLLLITGLSYCSSFSDKLIGYGIILMLVTFSSQLVHVLYCRRCFSESNYHFIWDRKRVVEMSGFAGWSFMGTGAGVLRDHGVNLLINVFCGPTVNAARGISYSLSSAVNSFVRNFMVAINPQITKSYASGNEKNTKQLVHRGSLFTFYILLILALPILFETKFILSLWLNDYPYQTILFVRLLLVLSMMDTFSNTLNTLQLATGKIRTYQIVVGIVGMLNLPFSYLSLRQGEPASTTIMIAITLSFVCLILRLQLLQKMISFSMSNYLTQVVCKSMLVAICALPLPTILYSVIPEGVSRFVLLSVLSIFGTSVIVYALGCSVSERAFIRNNCIDLMHRIIVFLRINRYRSI